jgi:hypothetical protein
VPRNIDKMIAHDGPEFRVRSLQHNETAERLQAGSPWATAAR